MTGLRVLAVSELAWYLQQLFRLTPALSDLWVRGEVADLRRSPAGHCYFSLRDEEAQVKCVLFRSAAFRLAALPQAGRTLVVHGSLDFYAAGGLCELRVDLVSPEGVGLQRLQLEALKLKLEQEGLFAVERKRPLPAFPRRIGVVASEGGAVIHDILTVLRRRYPLVEVVFAPSAVQGERAPDELVAALRRLGRFEREGRGVDLVILARGGGSEDDLAAFNDERVARAVYACQVPVLSAIGHETDYTLADLVADLRAPTPSAAAELATPDRAALGRDVRRLADDAADALRAHLASLHQEVAQSSQRLLLRSPEVLVQGHRAEVRACLARAEQRVLLHLREARYKLEARRLQLLTLDPVGTLERGYAICYNQAGNVVTSPAQVAPGQALRVQVSRGQVLGRVTETQEW
ncbi:MAG: exodeoxyribonuclease VII large subunit [Chloroflexi bacterium]|nr:exodeoxyribonuclease VII large subunit [Chloroflexota bacterium]